MASTGTLTVVRDSFRTGNLTGGSHWLNHTVSEWDGADEDVKAVGGTEIDELFCRALTVGSVSIGY